MLTSLIYEFDYVLGGHITQMPGYNYNNVSTDVDDLPYGIHRGGNLQGTPDANGMLVVLRTLPELTNVHTQIFYSIGGSIYIRSGYSGNWTGWMNITLTGQYPNLSSLATALGGPMIYSSEKDASLVTGGIDAITTGAYLFSTGEISVISGGGVLFAFNRRGSIAQIAIGCYSTPGIGVRSKVTGSDTWTAWKSVTLT